MESGLLQTDPSCANWSLGSFSSTSSHCLLTLQRSLLLSTHHWRKAGPWRLEGKGSKCVQVCAFARVHVGRCILEGPCGHNLICWCGHMWVGSGGGGKDVMGPRQLQVSSHLCGDLLSLDTGISFRPPDLLLSSDTHLPCGNGPVLPSLWASVSLSVEERD